MKTFFAILVFISFLLLSCLPVTPTQVSKVDDLEVGTEQPLTDLPATQQPISPAAPVAAPAPTQTPTETPLTCVTLISPINAAEIPAVGKVTFSWTANAQAEKYILKIMLPTGNPVSFETNQTSLDRYMEAFAMGGVYQWQVMVRGQGGSEICGSDVSKFNKPKYLPTEKLDGAVEPSTEDGEDNGQLTEPPDPPVPTGGPGG